MKSEKNGQQIRIAYSMFESTKIPSEWVGVLHKYFDMVVVPDPFYVDVYRSCGVNLPIFVVPLGLNLKQFLKEPIKQKAHDPFVFGNLSAAIERKNIVKLAQAFYEAFGDTEKVFLRLNCRYYDDDIKEEIDSFLKKNKIKNILFTQKCLNAKQYLETFQTLDCYVSPSKGEGYSIQPREAMALGIPVIVSNNTAQSTLCRSGLVYSLRSDLETPALRKWGRILKTPIQYGVDYDCTKEDLIESLKEVYNNYTHYISQAGQLRNWVKQYDFSQITPFYTSFVSPKKVSLGEVNSINEEGLVTNDAALYQKYKKLLARNSFGMPFRGISFSENRSFIR